MNKRIVLAVVASRLFFTLALESAYAGAPAPKPSAIPAGRTIDLTASVKSDDRPIGGGASDLLNSKDYNPDAARAGRSGSGVSLECVNESGKTLVSGDAGYSECLSAVQAPGSPGAAGVRPSAGMRWKIGK